MPELYSMGCLNVLNTRSFPEADRFTAIIKAVPAGWDMGNVLFVRK